MTPVIYFITFFIDSLPWAQSYASNHFAYGLNSFYCRPARAVDHEAQHYFEHDLMFLTSSSLELGPAKVLVEPWLTPGDHLTYVGISLCA